jgi:hypothetical protein
VEPRIEAITGLMLTLTRADCGPAAAASLPFFEAEGKQRQQEGQAKGREARKAGIAPIGAIPIAHRAAEDAAKAFVPTNSRGESGLSGTSSPTGGPAKKIAPSEKRARRRLRNRMPIQQSSWQKNINKIHVFRAL